MPKDQALALLVGAAQVLDEIAARTQDAAGGLSRTQLNCLSVVGTHEGIRLADLAGELGVTPSTGVRLIDRLTADKLVKRRENPDDRREIRLTITKQGLAVLEDAAEAGREAIGPILDRMGADGIQSLITGVGDFLDAAGYEPKSLVDAPKDDDES